MIQRGFSFSRTIVATLLLSAISPSPAQTGAKNGEWRTYGGDLGNTKYSPLDQIDASNFNTLKLAWRFHTENLGPKPEYNMEDTPLMVRSEGASGVVYTTAGGRRDAASGWRSAEGMSRTGRRRAVDFSGTAGHKKGREQKHPEKRQQGWNRALYRVRHITMILQTMIIQRDRHGTPPDGTAL